MKKNQILNKVSQNKMSVDKAYKKLFKEKKERNYPRAHFVKVKIQIRGKKGINMLLAVLFLLPIPLWLIGLILEKSGNKEQLDRETINEIKSMLEVKGCKLELTEKDARIKMSTI